MILDKIYDVTLEYSKKVTKNQRKSKGQFFTPPIVGKFMANLYKKNIKEITILDPGAGTGILSAAICENLLANEETEKIHLDLYENDATVLPILKDNMEYIKEIMFSFKKQFTYNIINSNFILDNLDHWNNDFNGKYDLVISNPPYKKLKKSCEESQGMASIVYGQPNIYFLFMAMSTKLLKEKGDFIFIVPRGFCNGAYFRKFREWFIDNISIEYIHLFQSRKDVFNSDDILQEALILKAVKSKNQSQNIIVSESIELDINNINKNLVPYNTVIHNKHSNVFIRIPTNKNQVELLNLMDSFNNTLLSLGFKLSTGPVVDFRNKAFLLDSNKIDGENTVPLLWAFHFNTNENKINFPIVNAKKTQVIINCDKSKKMLLDNANYIFTKRFSSKEEKKRIQCVMFSKGDIHTKKIGLENHLNYIKKVTGELSKEELYGLFTILNSTFIDQYFRIINGNTQVNATEMNILPMPPINDVLKIGKRAISKETLTTKDCDEIIEDIFNFKILKLVI